MENNKKTQKKEISNLWILILSLVFIFFSLWFINFVFDFIKKAGGK